MTSNQEFILFKLMQQLNLTSRLSLFVQIRHSVSTSDNYSGSCPRPINQFGVYFTNILKRNLQIKVTECSDSSMYIRIHKPSLNFKLPNVQSLRKKSRFISNSRETYIKIIWSQKTANKKNWSRMYGSQR